MGTKRHYIDLGKGYSIGRIKTKTIDGYNIIRPNNQVGFIPLNCAIKNLEKLVSKSSLTTKEKEETIKEIERSVWGS